MEDNTWISLSKGFKADIRWFTEYAKRSNGIYLFSPSRPTVELECDSSLLGGGGYAHPVCYTWEYTTDHKKKFPNIHHLEAVNILVAYQTLGTLNQIRPAKIVIYTDNMASSCVLSSGKTKDETLAACSRQLWLLASRNSQEIIIKHKPGDQIPIADALSRMSQDKVKRDFVTDVVIKKRLVFVPPVLNNYVFFASSL